MKTYLHALAAFVGFVAGEGSVLRCLGMTTHDLDTVCQKVITIAQTLRQDINRQAVEEAGQNPDGAIQLQPWMAGKYLEGVERDVARQLIHREIGGEPLSPREWCAVRNSLILQLLVSNFKRSGDLSHLERSVVPEAKVDPSGPNDGVEVFIIQHKEARSGKRCPLSKDAEVFSDIQLFARHLAKIKEEKNLKGYLFTTKEGSTILPTNMSKIIDVTWAAFGRRIKGDLPKLTGSGNRKLAVTTHREVGVDRQEQVALASYMAHRVDRADWYYNKGQLRAARSSAVKRVTSAYKEAERAHNQQGKEDVE
ncbi:uncharacterized protein LOC123529110 [Mercenaria mercenaria]|uniref:uncharacterized protein LOC123529110 n=1 Tax=Mercenaria mercenaria TaxID=6596 RepID=UPI00234EB40D|nr:uncharacterized protein LOC123529110 [Mercenaria mercenaria]